MVDPGAAQAIVKYLNRWYRRRSRPRGLTDYYFRGTRMVFNRTYRLANGFMGAVMLVVGSLLYLLPDILRDEPLWKQWLVKLGWIGITAAALLLLLQLFREFVVVTEDGLIKSNLLGQITRMDWSELVSFRWKLDENSVSFRNAARKKFSLSLCYDGWQDFMETAARRMKPELYWQVNYALAAVKSNDRPEKIKKSGPRKKWFSFPRQPGR